MIPYLMLIAGLIKLVAECAKHPVAWMQLVWLAGGFHASVLVSSARERFKMGGWACIDLTAIRGEANRRLTHKFAIGICQFMLEIDDRVRKLELLNVDYVKAHMKMAGALQAYLSSLQQWDRFSAPPPGLGSRGTAFATAIKDYLIQTPPEARLLVNSGPRADAKVMSPVDRRIEQQQTEIPKAGDYLLRLLLPKRDRESIPGDLEEEFPFMVEKFGPGLAKLWYWVQVLSSIGAVAGNRLWRLWRFVAAAMLFRHFGN